LIGNVWIIDKKSGSCLIHRNYGKLAKIDSNLFSGLLTAIINFSLEITGGDFVRSVAMGVNKFYYHLSEDFIIAISMDANFTEDDAKPILQIILDSFISQGYAQKALTTNDVIVLQPFEEEIDQMVRTIEASIVISEDSQGNVEERKKQPITIDPETNLKKKEIEKAIENAEWALSGTNYKEAIKFFKIAAESFEFLLEMEMADWCYEMINLTKMLWLKAIGDGTKYISAPQDELIEPSTTKETNNNEIISSHKQISKNFEYIDEINKHSNTKTTPSIIGSSKTEELCKKIPYIIKKHGKNVKVKPPESLVIILCDGKNTIEDIAKKTKLTQLKVNEILRKFQKKNIIKIKRVIK